MNADMPLAERRRLEREQQAEIRAALVRRHVQVMDERAAIDAAQIGLDIRQAPAFRELAKRMRR